MMHDMISFQSFVLGRPESAHFTMPADKARLAVLCGPTAALSTAKLLHSTAKLSVRPKACALTWCLEARKRKLLGRIIGRSVFEQCRLHRP